MSTPNPFNKKNAEIFSTPHSFGAQEAGRVLWALDHAVAHVRNAKRAEVYSQVVRYAVAPPAAEVAPSYSVYSQPANEQSPTEITPSANMTTEQNATQAARDRVAEALAEIGYVQGDLDAAA